MKTFEYESDCPPVERLIWSKVAIGYGSFEGVKELSFTDLCEIKSATEFQLAKMLKDSEDTGT